MATITTANRSRLVSRLAATGQRLRVLVLTNEHADGDHPGHRDAFAALELDGGIELFLWAAPNMLAKTKGEHGALRALVELIVAYEPNVVVQFAIQGFPFTEEWFRTVEGTPARPVLLYIEQDAWGRWSKPVNAETRVWWRAADIVFSVAIGEQCRLIQRHGGREVRHIPNTYDHIEFAREEHEAPDTHGDYRDVVVIGNRWGNPYVSRLPGARQRARLVRDLQRDPAIPLALFGHGWTGRGVRGHIKPDDQAAAARRGLMTANWDHFPSYEAYSSNRLSVQLLAGRVHVTTWHPGHEWLPGPDVGLFLERSVRDVVARVRELLALPRQDVLELGAEGHRWVRHRLSDRELARYVLGAIDDRLLEKLPTDPWTRLPH